MKAVTLLLQTAARPYPCNPIQGHREAEICPSMYFTGGGLVFQSLVYQRETNTLVYTSGH